MQNNNIKNFTNYFKRISESKEPLEIFSERDSRLDLIATVPIVTYVVLWISSWVYFKLGSGGYPANRHWGIYIGFALIFFLLVLNLRPNKYFKKILNISTKKSRFYFDLPLLWFSLTIIFWCFDITNANKHPFLLTVYALCVASGASTVKFWLYEIATHAIGILYPIGYFFLYNHYMVIGPGNNEAFNSLPSVIQVIFTNAPPPLTDIPSLVYAFLSVYLGFFFNDIFKLITGLIKFVCHILAKIFRTASKSESEQVVD